MISAFLLELMNAHAFLPSFEYDAAQYEKDNDFYKVFRLIRSAAISGHKAANAELPNWYFDSALIYKKSFFYFDALADMSQAAKLGHEGAKKGLEPLLLDIFAYYENTQSLRVSNPELD